MQHSHARSTVKSVTGAPGVHVHNVEWKGVRHRTVEVDAHQGEPCPPLQEERSCGTTPLLPILPS